MHRVHLAGVLVPLALATAVTAQSPFAQTVCFGDSLTANELFGLWFQRPKALWGWDPIEAVFRKGAGSSDQLAVHAFSGARGQELRAQVGAYGLQCLRGLRLPGTLFSWEAGTNDVLTNLGLLARHGPGQHPAADQVLDQLLWQAFNQVSLLLAYHPAARIVLWTIPDVTLMPGNLGLSEQEQDRVRAHLLRANEVLRAFEVWPQVTVLDLCELWQAAVTRPPVVGGRVILPPPVWGRPDALFADPVHPSAVFNLLAANQLIPRMNRRWALGLPTYSEAELAAVLRVP